MVAEMRGRLFVNDILVAETLMSVAYHSNRGHFDPDALARLVIKELEAVPNEYRQAYVAGLEALGETMGKLK